MDKKGRHFIFFYFDFVANHTITPRPFFHLRLMNWMVRQTTELEVNMNRQAGRAGHAATAVLRCAALSPHMLRVPP